jgi:hypothetical protein
MFDEKISDVKDVIHSLELKLNMLEHCRAEFKDDLMEAETQAYLEKQMLKYAEEPDELTHWDGDDTDRIQY